MTRIGSNSVDPELDQGQITFFTAGVARAAIDGLGNFTNTAGGLTFRGLTGGAYSVTSASAASAGSTSSVSSTTVALSGVSIPHSLGSTPTLFGAEATNAQAGLADILGAYVTADSSFVTVNYAQSFTASKIYTFSWYAAP